MLGMRLLSAYGGTGIIPTSIVNIPTIAITQYRPIKCILQNTFGSIAGPIIGFTNRCSYSFPIYKSTQHRNLKFLCAKDVFTKFWEALDNTFQIPMMFVRSGLAIPIDTERYTENVDTPESAQWEIDRMLYDIDNQLNMDW